MDLTGDGFLFGLDENFIIPSKRRKKQKTVSKIKQFRLAHKIKILIINKRCSLPLFIDSFEVLSNELFNFNEMLLQNVAQLLFHTPTPVQSQSIPILFNHRNLIACAPTGSGKTAAYLIPVLNHAISFYQSDCLSSNPESLPTHKIHLLSIILAPTQELIRQIWSEAIRLSKGCVNVPLIACLSSKHYTVRCKSVPKSKNNKSDHAPKQSRELRLHKKTKILISTPYRIGKLLSLSSDQCPFDLSNLSYVVIDECDKMLETNVALDTNSQTNVNNKQSHKRRSFRDQLNPLLVAIAKTIPILNTSNQFCISMFSATVPDVVAKWACNELPNFLNSHNQSNELIQLRVGIRNATVSTVKQELRYCASEQGKLLEMQYLLKSGLTYPCLIFMESRQRANEILKEILLSDSHIMANVISSDKTESQRASVVCAFREGKLHVLICTDLLGRGIDFKGVSMVVNYDLPPSKLEYIHRVGRTGRAGQQGRAITLWTDSDLPNMSDILKVMKRSGSQVDAELERLIENWKRRRVDIMTSKKSTSKVNRVTDRVISRRRGERRLSRKLVKKMAKQSGQTDDNNQEKLKWLRPWNPYRGRISDVPGSKQERSTNKNKSN